MGRGAEPPRDHGHQQGEGRARLDAQVQRDRGAARHDPGAQLTLVEIADELYGIAPEEFTATRDARAKQARASDRSLADSIKKLQRPSKAAWLVNLLVRRESEQVEQLLSLGDALREATEALAGEDLKRLGQQRHQVIYFLAQQARRLAKQPVTDTVERELESTLEAALADPDAAGAVRSGRLLRALAPNGLDPVDVSGAVALPDAAAAARPARKQRTPEPDRTPDPQRVAAARQALEDAEQAAEDSAATLREAERTAAEAAERDSAAADRVAALEQELTQARAAHEQAAAAARERVREREQAARDDRTAQRALDRARSAWETVQKG